jgi:hypothetical protein
MEEDIPPCNTDSSTCTSEALDTTIGMQELEDAVAESVTIWRTAANFSPLIFPCYLLLTFVWFPLISFLLTSGLFGCVITCFVLFGLL